MEKITADFLFIGSGGLLENKVLIHEGGKIVDIIDIDKCDPGEVQHFSGILCPGFINTHCHLELSHMKGRIDSGTGLLPFLQAVVGFRDIEQEVIDAAIIEGDKEMKENGIVAVGDISNKLDTVHTKSSSELAYHTFVEMFDFIQPSFTKKTIDQYREVYKGQAANGNNKKSYVPHAPYTVSEGLFEFIRENNTEDVTISIHNQETVHENELFLSKSGGFLDFYQSFGFSLDHFQPSGKSAIHYALQHLNPHNRTLFIHNTTTTDEDIHAAHEWSDKVFWATCANANLYIENQLPDYQAFLNKEAKMTIGTDSLSSNWSLSILDEIQTIKKYKSFIPLSTLLQWATGNGAEALGYDDHLGFFRKGYRPGINLISASIIEEHIDISEAGVTRLI